MHKGYVNAGYTIQIFHEIGNDGVAIGVRSGIKGDPAPFVVWNYSMSGGDPWFYWGFYCDDKCEAARAFVRKAQRLIGAQECVILRQMRIQGES